MRKRIDAGQAAYFIWKKYCDRLQAPVMRRFKKRGDEKWRLKKLAADLPLCQLL